MSANAIVRVDQTGAYSTPVERMLVVVDFDALLPAGSPVLPDAISARLAMLARSPRYFVALFSGHSVADLRSLTGLNLIFSGNHGLEIAGAGIFVRDVSLGPLRQLMDDVSWDLEAAFQTIRRVSVQRAGLSTLVDYHLTCADLSHWIIETVKMTVRPYGSRLNIVSGPGVCRLRPASASNKGAALCVLLERLQVKRVVICATEHDFENLTL